MLGFLAPKATTVVQKLCFMIIFFLPYEYLENIFDTKIITLSDVPSDTLHVHKPIEFDGTTKYLITCNYFQIIFWYILYMKIFTI